jgi:hypothetical protein
MFILNYDQTVRIPFEANAVIVILNKLILVERSTSKSIGRSHVASNNQYQFMNWYFVAAISFIIAVLIYQESLF